MAPCACVGGNSTDDRIPRIPNGRALLPTGIAFKVHTAKVVPLGREFGSESRRVFGAGLGKGAGPKRRQAERIRFRGRDEAVGAIAGTDAIWRNRSRVPGQSVVRVVVVLISRVEGGRQERPANSIWLLCRS